LVGSIHDDRPVGRKQEAGAGSRRQEQEAESRSRRQEH